VEIDAGGQGATWTVEPVQREKERDKSALEPEGISHYSDLGYWVAELRV
jgi:hypothetical protein